jgi:hypothetical protein
MVSLRSFTAHSGLLKLAFVVIIVKELMGYPCLRTTVTYVSSLNRFEIGEDETPSLRPAPEGHGQA